MEIFGVEFESWNTLILRLNWLAIVASFILVYVGIKISKKYFSGTL